MDHRRRLRRTIRVCRPPSSFWMIGSGVIGGTLCDVLFTPPCCCGGACVGLLLLLLID